MRPLHEKEAAWSRKWLKLQASHHAKLQELEFFSVQFCAGAWTSPERGWLFVVHGFNGSGKTHCAISIRNWIRHVGHAKQFLEREQQMIKTLQCTYWTWPELMDEFRNGGWDIVTDLFDTPVLIIDELAGGHDPSRVGVDKLCQVLSRREWKWTMITTNAQPKEWPEVFDRRIASRFLRNSIIVDTSGVPDFSAI